MAIQDSQKIDYLWKKLGYGAAKTDTNSNKLAPNEAIASPLILRGDKVWQQAEDIPTVMPSENGDVVDVYLTSAPDECTNDGFFFAMKLLRLSCRFLFIADDAWSPWKV